MSPERYTSTRLSDVTVARDAALHQSPMCYALGSYRARRRLSLREHHRQQLVSPAELGLQMATGDKSEDPLRSASLLRSAALPNGEPMVELTERHEAPGRTSVSLRNARLIFGLRRWKSCFEPGRAALRHTGHRAFATELADRSRLDFTVQNLHAFRPRSRATSSLWYYFPAALTGCSACGEPKCAKGAQ